MRVVISGATGLIGTALTDHLRAEGHQVVGLVRGRPGPNDVQWDPAAGVLPDDALDGAQAVINLAGAGIGDHRWTDAYKAELRDSRLRATGLLAERIAQRGTAGDGPTVLLNASAIGYYGPRGDEELDETSAGGDDFLARLCHDWEAATAPAANAGARVAFLRTGIVLTPKGGALKKLLPLFRFGLGGRFGNGKQWQSWVSLPDEVAAITHLLTADVEGPVNLTAPNPVTNVEFTRVLGQVMKRPALLFVPKFGPKLLLGSELADALLFTGQRVLPQVLQQSGYRFQHETLDAALRAVLDR